MGSCYDDLCALVAELLKIGKDAHLSPDVLKAWSDEATKVGERLKERHSLPEESKRNLQLNLINRLGQQDVWKMDLQDFFDMAVVSIRESLGYYNVSIFRIDETSQDLVLTAHAGAYRGRVSKGYHQGIDRGMLGWVARNGRMLLTNDVSREPAYLAVEGLATKSEICIPILIEGKIEGVLNVESDVVGAFDQGDVVALETLAQQVADVVQMRRTNQAFDLLKAEIRHSFGQFIGRSEVMRKVFDLIRTVARSDMIVLIRGETGTGKELVARAIHAESRRKDRPFIAVNCAALPESLFESELFGHERGAFTGADRRRVGKMEMARGGTLFLDEIGEIPYPLQAKLLRAIEGQAFTRVGGEQEIQVDVRILSATNQPLEELEQQGRFRRDLYFRLNAVQIHLPPLRERIEDLPLLAAHFLREACARLDKRIDAIAPAVLAALTAYAWPGNIRELENAIARAALMEQTSCLSQIDLPQVKNPAAELRGIKTQNP
ncbi:MAG: sigma-54-dependent Fis family transcriptional regulator [Candidatus Latescibacteria bacterium]|nr:sigma-54-dependent Fis family transcriptional regulator [Candidatus Latescibacterota bacterium]